MTFINPANLVNKLEVPSGGTVVDFGCGAGYFCIPAAKAAGDSGTVYAIDLLPARLEATASSARYAGLRNVVTIQADLEKPLADTHVAKTSADLVIMANIIHQVNKLPILLANAYRILKTGGKILVVEWHPHKLLFGPPVASRVSLPELAVMCERLGLRQEKEMDADSFHYAAVFVK